MEISKKFKEKLSLTTGLPAGRRVSTDCSETFIFLSFSFPFHLQMFNNSLTVFIYINPLIVIPAQAGIQSEGNNTNYQNNVLKAKCLVILEY
jgi:hypothetical protein